MHYPAQHNHLVPEMTPRGDGIVRLNQIELCAATVGWASLPLSLSMT